MSPHLFQRTPSHIPVVQVVRHWLAMTENWIYRQICRLPGHWAGGVICQTQENSDRFPIAPLFCRSAAVGDQVFLEKWLGHLGVFPLGGFLGKTLRDLRPQLLHSHFGNVGWENASLARRLRIRHVVSFYGFDASRLPRRSPIWQRRYQGLFEQADRFLCEGPHLGRSLENLGCPKEKIRVHHLGVNLEQIPFLPREFPVGEPIRVLIAASFREKKGIPLALAALGRFQREHPLAITMIGDADSSEAAGREKRSILQAIADHRLEGQVRLVGYQPQETLMKEAARHHLFMATSVTANDGDTEGGAPVTVIEMAASGMPIVASRHCDIPEVLRPYPSDLLSEEKDIDGILHSLRWFVKHGAARKRLLEETRGWIEAEYDDRKQGERLAAIYESLK